MMPTKEKVLELGCEGAGIAIFRFQKPEENPTYQIEFVFLTLDENDDEEWKTAKSQQFPSFINALETIGPKGNWIGLTPIWIHPKFKELVLVMVNTAAIQNEGQETEYWTYARDRWWEFLKEE